MNKGLILSLMGNIVLVYILYTVLSTNQQPTSMYVNEAKGDVIHIDKEISETQETHSWSCQKEEYIDFWKSNRAEMEQTHPMADDVFLTQSKLCTQNGRREEVNIIDVGSNKGYTLLRYAFAYNNLDEHLFKSLDVPKDFYNPPQINLNVYAIEPRHDNVIISQNAVRTYIDDSYKFFEIGMSDFVGNASFLEIDNAGSEVSRLTGKETADSFKPERNAVEKEISVVTMDLFAEQENIKHLVFVKIDVEGFDGSVIHGMERILSDGRVDVIQFEYHAHWRRNPKGYTLEDVTMFLAGFHYQSFIIAAKDGRPVLVRIEDKFWDGMYETKTIMNILSINSELRCCVELSGVFAPPACAFNSSVV